MGDKKFALQKNLKYEYHQCLPRLLGMILASRQVIFHLLSVSHLSLVNFQFPCKTLCISFVWSDRVLCLSHWIINYDPLLLLIENQESIYEGEVTGQMIPFPGMVTHQEITRRGAGSPSRGFAYDAKPPSTRRLFLSRRFNKTCSHLWRRPQQCRS